VVVVIFIGKHLLTKEGGVEDSSFVFKQDEVVLSDNELAALREQFKAALTQYEVNIQPSINEIMLSDFEPQRASELTLLKDQGVTAFAQGGFTQAKTLLTSLDEKSKQLIDEWKAQIVKHVENGQAYFDEDQIPQAQLSVNKALALSSTNMQALELQNRIDAHGEVSILMDDLNIAITENNWPKQVEVITGIIELDPERTELQDDLAKAKLSLQQQQLASYLQQADAALIAGQLSRAESFVNKAKTIKSNSKGAQALSARINQVRAQQGLAGTKASLKAAANIDDWEKVNSLSSSTLIRYPNDAEVKQFQTQSKQVLSAKQSLSIFAARPERLSDDNIRAAASNAIQGAFAASMASPSLQKQIEQVANAIDQYNNPVEVNVISDGKTYITVLGVGHVGEHKDKVISLTPGNYVLHGKREGFRNKRLEFIVKANTPISLTLICDERI
jgi:hypothetical protein